ncbi:MAG: ABC transporter substrate-binding protein [Coriobacteriia bacterium]|nr:ABC transporter substrate-binding protein [Coriobacteriia bacterium]
MKAKKLSLLTLLLSLMLVLSACGANAGDAQKPDDKASQEVSQNESKAAEQAEPKPAEKADEKAEAKDADTVVITDMNGREVEIPTPDKLKKVYYEAPIGEVMVYTVDPSRMGGLVSTLNDKQKKYMPLAKDLEVIAPFNSKGAGFNTEEILASGAQVYIHMGPMGMTEKNAKAADEMQDKLKIPVVVVDGTFPQRAEAYRFLGKIFDVEERAEMLAQYCEKTYKEITEKAEAIPDDQRVRLYYAEGPEGLNTDPEGSAHSAIFKYAGAKNVADVELKPGVGMTPVSMEQILEWNPDVIFMGQMKDNPYEKIMNEPQWKNIKAVQDGRVYMAPNMPFSWIDRPPSSQQYLGIKYVANTLYPEVFDFDLTKETQEFFKLFYQVEISEDEANELLSAAK